MTTIIGVEYADGFVMASDSQITSDDRAYTSNDVPKITQVAEYTIAGAGISRYCDVVMYGWNPPKFVPGDDYIFMVSKFIPAMRKAHEDCGYTLKDEDTFQFIVGVNKKLYYINYDYSVIRSDNGIYGIGSGAQYAIGALEVGATMREAMKASIKYDVNSGGKIRIVKRGKLDA